MLYEFETIDTDSLFLSYFPRKATEAELREGLPETVSGFRPSGVAFIDLLLRIFHEKGYISVTRSAALLKVDKVAMQYTISLLTGKTYTEFRNQMIAKMIEEMLTQTSLSFQEIARKLHLKSVSNLSHFYSRMTRKSLYETRKGRRFHLS